MSGYDHPGVGRLTQEPKSHVYRRILATEPEDVPVELVGSVETIYNVSFISDQENDCKMEQVLYL